MTQGKRKASAIARLVQSRRAMLVLVAVRFMSTSAMPSPSATAIRSAPTRVSTR